MGNIVYLVFLFTLNICQEAELLYHMVVPFLIFFNLKDFIYLFLERGEGREKERERNIHVWLPLTGPLLGTWPASRACVLTGNQTGNSGFQANTQSTNPHQSGVFLIS